MYVCVNCIGFASVYDFHIGLRNCCDMVVYFLFFISLWQIITMTHLFGVSLWYNVSDLSSASFHWNKDCHNILRIHHWCTTSSIFLNSYRKSIFIEHCYLLKDEIQWSSCFNWRAKNNIEVLIQCQWINFNICCIYLSVISVGVIFQNVRFLSW